MEENQEIKKNKSKEFLKNNLPIILILCLGFAIRVYYFILTKNQFTSTFPFFLPSTLVESRNGGLSEIIQG